MMRGDSAGYFPAIYVVRDQAGSKRDDDDKEEEFFNHLGGQR
jgi:hypothetical protein